MRNLLFFSVIVILLCVSGCQSSGKESHELTQAQKDSIERVRLDSIKVADSIRVAEQIKADSIANVRRLERDAQIASLSKNFSIKKDEFSNKSWVQHKNAPKYRNQNGVYLYFQVDQNNHPSNLRFCVQYEDDDWLFIRNMIFNIDGENIRFIPNDMETDCGNGGRIWEWCDELASLGDNMDIINKIAAANSVKIKMNGRQYYDTRTMSAKSLRAFKETLNYYNALAND